MKELKNEKLFTTHGFNGCDLDCLTGREIASQHASPDDQAVADSATLRFTVGF